MRRWVGKIGALRLLGKTISSAEAQIRIPANLQEHICASGDPNDTSGDSDPWPVEPDGTGYSLSRINQAEYGNDPANWQAAIPSPGLFNP